MNNKEFDPVLSESAEHQGTGSLNVAAHNKINQSQPKLNIVTLTLDYYPQLAHDLFAGIEAQPWSILLRSASKTHPDSRFDILSAKPIATLLTNTLVPPDEAQLSGETKALVAPQTTISFADPNREDIQSNDDPFALLARLQQELLPDIDASLDLPFIGGALGYFSYDLGRYIEPNTISVTSKAATSKTVTTPDLTVADMAMGLYDWALIVDHQLKQALIVAPNLIEAERRLLWLKSYQKEESKIRSIPFKLTSPWQSNMDKSSYRSKFEQIQAYLQSGDCYQINLAQRFNASYSGSEWQAYSRLESSNQAPFSAFIRTPECVVLSISPERFLALNKRCIETKPIKGTLPRSNDPIVDKKNAHRLRHSMKDQAENLMIVDLLRNDIGKVAQIGTVKVPKLFDIESFPSVHHLVSTITAKLDAKHQAYDLLRSCFPGGSITGAPKIRAMQIIDQLEPNRRTVYCGSVAYISRHQRMDSNITIRTLVAHKNQLYTWAGGGIVADSQCDAEYQETLDKLNRILPILHQSPLDASE